MLGLEVPCDRGEQRVRAIFPSTVGHALGLFLLRPLRQKLKSCATRQLLGLMVITFHYLDGSDAFMGIYIG